MDKFKNENIYAFNILRSTKALLDENYSFLISTLMHIESEMECNNLKLKDFANTLLEVINNSNAFKNIDRVCLSLTHPGASKISVLSSANTSNLKDNRMSPGYSCFVSNSSSVFKTKNSNIRIYSNIDDIVDRYYGAPIQRSLSKLKAMGVKSGITIPLNLSNLASGFLFINSANEGTFDDLKPEDYTILCFIKLIAMSCMNKTLFGIDGIDNRVGRLLTEVHQEKNSFCEHEFTKNLTALIGARFDKIIKINVENNIKESFLFPMTPTIYLIIKAMEYCNVISSKLDFHFDLKDGETVRIEVKGIEIAHNLSTVFQDLGFYTSQKISYNDEDLFIEFDYDEAKLADYSI
ncbi:hypothetical protein HBN50_12940 [Halobacteriovorax sp. GB3]|uniref:hypothetical protein n=1 Tax=Halobacteriovorax sp. GB3 TaxID=2719615 RepID=UPI00235EB66B|nr:hypothetical protein [Halobacteriovorax sp. GB3]MDD0854011.1 hypothetical protein [Halobacteriovorax sp. GB3]